MLIPRPDSPGEPGRNDTCPCGSGRKFKQCCAPIPAAERPVAGAVAERARIASLRDAGRFLEAERSAAELIRRQKLDAPSHAALGLVLFYAGRAEPAAASFHRACQLDPRDAGHRYHFGLALEHLGRLHEAIVAFRAALALAPNDAATRERLGILLLHHGDRAGALDCLHHVARAEPQTLRGRLCAAQAAIEEDRHEDAEHDLRATIAAYPDRAEAYRLLAQLLRQHGRFAEAMPLLERATEGSPAQAAHAYYDLALSKRITEADRPMLDQMQALLSYRPLALLRRARVHHGLGKAFDDLGDYEAAMRQFDAANEIAASRHPFDRALFGASVNRLIAASTPAFFAEHRHLGSSSELPVLILGMPRSGTTLVEQIVSAHPQVAGADELPFWTEAAAGLARPGSAGLTAAEAARLIADYETTLRRVGPAAERVTDKMPGNFLWIGLFHTLFPRGRILHCRRNPVDTCLSNYFADFTAPMPFTYDKGHLAFYFRTYSRLAAHWRRVLPPETLLEVDYETLVAEPERITRRMIDFIGLDWNEACLRPQDNRRIIKTASLWQARQPVYTSSTDRWRKYQPWLGALATLLTGDDPADVIEPKSASPALGPAAASRAAGRPDAAIAALRQGLRQAPYDPVLYADLGLTLLQAGQPDAAIDCLERAIGLAPRFATAHATMALALDRLGRVMEAVAAHQLAVALSPALAAVSEQP